MPNLPWFPPAREQVSLSLQLELPLDLPGPAPRRPAPPRTTQERERTLCSALMPDWEQGELFPALAPAPPVVPLGHGPGPIVLHDDLVLGSA